MYIGNIICAEEDGDKVPTYCSNIRCYVQRVTLNKIPTGKI